MRRLSTKIRAVVVLTLGLGAISALCGAFGAPVAAQPTRARTPALPVQRADGGPVDVIEVSGWIDPVLVDFVRQAIEAANDSGSTALVVQLNSPGVVVSDSQFERLLAEIRASEVPVGVWVGPSGAQATRRAAELVTSAAYAAVSPGSKVQVGDRRLGADAALDQDVTDFAAPTVGDFVVSLPGVESSEVKQGDEVRLRPDTQVRFAKLPLLSRLMHTVASPAVAYLLFVIGLGLILFELYTAGVGIAGVVGAVSFLLACYGLAVLPTNPVGVGLLAFSIFGYGVDIQTGAPRVWTGIATVSFVAGSLMLFDDGVTLSWITLVVAIVGMAFAMLTGMPAMVRSRFSTPTIGREWMLGEEGVAVDAIDPDGVVLVRDASWRARTNRATPIVAGQPVRVAAIEGLVLEVEPLEGAARDYRERRPRQEAATAGDATTRSGEQTS